MTKDELSAELERQAQSFVATTGAEVVLYAPNLSDKHKALSLPRELKLCCTPPSASLTASLGARSRAC